MASQFQHFKTAAVAVTVVEGFAVMVELVAEAAFFMGSCRLAFVALFDFDFPFLAEATVATVVGFFILPFGAR